jgi:hypothetical protein
MEPRPAESTVNTVRGYEEVKVVEKENDPSSTESTSSVRESASEQPKVILPILSRPRKPSTPPPTKDQVDKEQMRELSPQKGAPASGEPATINLSTQATSSIGERVEGSSASQLPAKYTNTEKQVKYTPSVTFSKPISLPFLSRYKLSTSSPPIKLPKDEMKTSASPSKASEQHDEESADNGKVSKENKISPLPPQRPIKVENKPIEPPVLNRSIQPSKMAGKVNDSYADTRSRNIAHEPIDATILSRYPQRVPNRATSAKEADRTAIASNQKPSVPSGIENTVFGRSPRSLSVGNNEKGDSSSSLKAGLSGAPREIALMKGKADSDKPSSSDSSTVHSGNLVLTTSSSRTTTSSTPLPNVANQYVLSLSQILSAESGTSKAATSRVSRLGTNIMTRPSVRSNSTTNVATNGLNTDTRDMKDGLNTDARDMKDTLHHNIVLEADQQHAGKDKSSKSISGKNQSVQQGGPDAFSKNNEPPRANNPRKVSIQSPFRKAALVDSNNEKPETSMLKMLEAGIYPVSFQESRACGFQQGKARNEHVENETASKKGHCLDVVRIQFVEGR